MRSGSLRVRLIVAAALALAVALIVAGVVLTTLFEQQFRDRVSRELANHMRQLVAALDIANDGTVTVVGELADPRFSQPLSGLYWKLTSSTGVTLTSRSLWDTDIAPLDASASPASGDKLVDGKTLDGTPLLVLTRRITAQRPAGDVTIDIEVAIERREIAEPMSLYVRNLSLALGLLAVFLIIAVWVQVGIGLRPLSLLQQRLSAVRAGRAARLDGSYPAEITPLVTELNQLVEAQRVSLERARARAGDLAHGLKTPLAVLASLSGDLERAGNPDASAEIDRQTEAMRAHVERELTRARLAAGRSRASCLLSGEFNHLIAIMKRLPRGADIIWDLACSDDLEMAMDEVDFVELFGNILDNARKWARSRIAITAARKEGQLIIAIADDGPGVAEEKLDAILQRGRRLSEGKDGFGLGLAIAVEVAKAYGFDLTLARSRFGGLEVRLSGAG